MNDYEKLRNTVSNSIVKLSKLATGLNMTLHKLRGEELVADALAEVISDLERSIDSRETLARLLRRAPALTLNDQIERLNQEYTALYNLAYQARSKFGIGMNVDWSLVNKGLDDFLRYRDFLAGEGVRFTEHPAHKDELTDEMVKAAFEKTKSYRGAAKILGCDHKTVKDRLRRMGYIKE